MISPFLIWSFLVVLAIGSPEWDTANRSNVDVMKNRIVAQETRVYGEVFPESSKDEFGFYGVMDANVPLFQSEAAAISSGVKIVAVRGAGNQYAAESIFVFSDSTIAATDPDTGSVDLDLKASIDSFNQDIAIAGTRPAEIYDRQLILMGRVIKLKANLLSAQKRELLQRAIKKSTSARLLAKGLFGSFKNGIATESGGRYVYDAGFVKAVILPSGDMQVEVTNPANAVRADGVIEVFQNSPDGNIGTEFDNLMATFDEEVDKFIGSDAYPMSKNFINTFYNLKFNEDGLDFKSDQVKLRIRTEVKRRLQFNRAARAFPFIVRQQSNSPEEQQARNLELKFETLADQVRTKMSNNKAIRTRVNVFQDNLKNANNALDRESMVNLATSDENHAVVIRGYLDLERAAGLDGGAQSSITAFSDEVIFAGCSRTRKRQACTGLTKFDIDIDGITNHGTFVNAMKSGLNGKMSLATAYSKLARPGLRKGAKPIQRIRQLAATLALKRLASRMDSGKTINNARAALMKDLHPSIQKAIGLVQQRDLLMNTNGFKNDPQDRQSISDTLMSLGKSIRGFNDDYSTDMKMSALLKQAESNDKLHGSLGISSDFSRSIQLSGLREALSEQIDKALDAGDGNKLESHIETMNALNLIDNDVTLDLRGAEQDARKKVWVKKASGMKVMGKQVQQLKTPVDHVVRLGQALSATKEFRTMFPRIEFEDPADIAEVANAFVQQDKQGEGGDQLELFSFLAGVTDKDGMTVRLHAAVSKFWGSKTGLPNSMKAVASKVKTIAKQGTMKPQTKLSTRDKR